MGRARVRLAVGSMLFVSGGSALIYQTTWLRSFRLIFGASTTASAAVLAIFMGGLGFGGLWLGRIAEQKARPLVFYARLELLIALGAAMTPFLVGLVRLLYTGIGGATVLGEGMATLLRLVLAALVLALPVIAMGGTLPAAARAVTGAEDLGRKGLALIYGVNTLGSVSGALLSTFYLFERLGTRTTLWTAALANSGVALAAWMLGRRLPDLTDKAPAQASAGEERLSPAFVLGAAFAVGFCFFLAELVWYRMSAPILGGTTYTFGLVLALALFGIGAGGTCYAFFGPSTPHLGHFALSCALEALLLLVPYAAGDDLAVLAAELRTLAPYSFVTLSIGWAAIAAAIVLPPAFVAGYQFPLLFALKGRGAGGVSTDVGLIYGANTFGAIAGSLAGGFGLLPLLSAPGAWLLSAFLLLAVALLAGVRAMRADPVRAAIIGAVAVASGFFLSARGPTATWRHESVGSGRSHLNQASWNEEREAELRPRRTLLAEREGVESSVGVRVTNGLAIHVNGKTDGNAITDATTTVVGPLIGAIQHPRPERAFVLGLLTGETAGWIAAIPSIKKVDVYELEPSMIDYARQCAAANQGALDNPKLEVHIGDAREALISSPESYDLVFSEPSNPFRAGIASLYAKEFYEGAAKRLLPNGLFLQFIQAYEVDPATIMIAVATMRSAFKEVSIWRMTLGDLLIVGSQEPQIADVARIRSRLLEEPYRSAFQRIARVYDVEGFLSMHLAGARMSDLIRGRVEAVNTDDNNVLEYQFAKTLGKSEVFLSPEQIFIPAAERGLDRAATENGEVDWTAVQGLRFRAWHVPLKAAPILAAQTPEDLFWRANIANDRAAADLADHLGPPRDSFEALARAEVRARRPRRPEEREKFQAELDALSAQGLASDAAWLALVGAVVDRQGDIPALAERAAQAARKDPWIWSPVLGRGLAQLRAAALDPGVARAVAKALAEAPFALYHAEEARLQTAALLAERGGDLGLCARIYETYEPSPIWTHAALKARLGCYAASHHPKAPEAKDDLLLYESHVPRSLEERLHEALGTPGGTSP